MKLKKRGWYNKKIDAIAKTFAKQRDGYICQRCKEFVEGSNAHGSHVIPVSAGNVLRWDLLNIKCLSYHNHINWWHKNPTESAEWFNSEFPDRAEHVKKRRHMTIKIPLSSLAEFYNEARSCESWEEYAEVYERKFSEWI